MRILSRRLVAWLVLILPITTESATAGVLDFIFGSSDSCTQYSDFTCDQLERSSYNVYFYFPDSREKFLGQSSSLTGCNAMAVGEANLNNLSRSDSWGYICCLIANGSGCYEKHR
jgi:hypothetical protein